MVSTNRLAKAKENVPLTFLLKRVENMLTSMFQLSFFLSIHLLYQKPSKYNELEYMMSLCKLRMGFYLIVM